MHILGSVIRKGGRRKKKCLDRGVRVVSRDEYEDVELDSNVLLIQDLVAIAMMQVSETFQERDLSGDDYVALFLDGKMFGDTVMVVALGVTMEGQNRVLGFVQTTTENKLVLTECLRSLLGRGLDISEGIYVVIDGSKGLRSAVRTALSKRSVTGRCHWHKRENVVSRNVILHDMRPYGATDPCVVAFAYWTPLLTAADWEVNPDATQVRKRKRARVRQMAARTARDKRSVAPALREHWRGRARSQMACNRARLCRFAPWSCVALRLGTLMPERRCSVSERGS